MPQVYGAYGPAHPRAGRWVFKAMKSFITATYARRQFYRPESPYAGEAAASMWKKLRRGESVYLLGITPAGHNSGVALVEASLERGVNLICNEEEERYTGIKHFAGYPEQSVEAIKERMAGMGLGPRDVHACLAGWCYMDVIPQGLRAVAEHAPESLALLHPPKGSEANAHGMRGVSRTPERLGRQLGLEGPVPIIAMRHHDNHAYFSYGVSPFAGNAEAVLVTVLDGYGDEGAVSLYVARGGKLERVHCNDSTFDSLGLLYGIISSTQGGWTALSSEGRYMGATAWGNNSRLTNPYYRRLRQLVYFGAEGRVYVNRLMAGWHKWGEQRPYAPALTEVLGEPIPLEKQWNPDAVLRVENIQHASITRERLDKAAATQLVFEDALFHILEHMIRTTGSDKLVLTGGTALNCVANMRLLDNFDASYYRRYFGRNARLHLWVPPTPSDTGVAMGAAYNFALSNGVPLGERLRHAFYCGAPPTSDAIRQALEAADDVAHLPLGNVNGAGQREQLADFAAYVVSRDGVLGLFQGSAETGPRALGHRSIVANPCNPHTLENINNLVKYREKVRPLAPMATYEAAQRLFELAPGASDDDHNSYNYMVISARARPESYKLIPAVIHHDGTSRVQIVREDIDPITHAFLKAMGRRAGVEVAVNTSLNVASPIVQTPAQALEALRRSKGMTGLIMIGREGDVFLAWHNVISPPKDAGEHLLDLYRNWRLEVGEPADSPAEFLCR